MATPSDSDIQNDGQQEIDSAITAASSGNDRPIEHHDTEDGDDPEFEALLRRAAAPESTIDVERSPLREGDVLQDRYRIDSILGQGGIGVVFKAHDKILGRTVAIKILLPHAAKDPKTRARFDREARASVKISSEHVARVHDVGVMSNGEHFLVLEFLHGEDLGGVLEREKSLPMGDAVEYVLQACEALAECHANGIIHRDLKPSNVFLSRRPDGSPCVKVVDFGLAKNFALISNLSGEDSSTTQHGLLGTPRNMAPEQISSPGSVDPRTDVWGLGTVLYELVCGHAPFSASRIHELFAKILHQPPEKLTVGNVKIQPELERIILRCLEKDPEDRYQNIAALARDLTAFAPQSAWVHADRAERLLGKKGRRKAPSGRRDPTISILHAPSDSKLALLMAELLWSSLDLPAEAIRCVKADSDLPAAETLVCILSDESIVSPSFLLAVGAWQQSGKSLFPVLRPGFDVRRAKLPMPDRDLMRLGRREDLRHFLAKVGHDIGARIQPEDVYNPKINAIIARRPRRLRAWAVAAGLLTILTICASAFSVFTLRTGPVRIAGSGTLRYAVLESLPSNIAECKGFRMTIKDVGSLEAISEISSYEPKGDAAIMSVRVAHLLKRREERLNSDPRLRSASFVEVLVAEDNIGFFVHKENPLDWISRDSAHKILFEYEGSGPIQWKDMGVPATHPLANDPVELILPRGCRNTSGTCAVVEEALRGDAKEKIQPIGQLGRSKEEISSLSNDIANNRRAIGFVSEGLDDKTAKRIAVKTSSDGSGEAISFKRGLWVYVYLPSKNALPNPVCSLLRCLLQDQTQGGFPKRKLIPISPKLLEWQRRALGLGPGGASCAVARSEYTPLRLGPGIDDGIILQIPQ